MRRSKYTSLVYPANFEEEAEHVVPRSIDRLKIDGLFEGLRGRERETES